MAYTVGRLFDMVDHELKQIDDSHMTSSVDNLKSAKFLDKVYWVNQSLPKLASINPSLWERVKEIIPTTGVNLTSEGLDVQAEWQELKSITIEGTDYNVGIYIDQSNTYYHVRSNIIQKRDSSFDEGVAVQLWGIFKPEMVPDIEEAIVILDADDPGGAPHTEDQAVTYIRSLTLDIDSLYIRPVVLDMLLKESARTGISAGLWVNEFRMELQRFQKASSPVKRVGKNANNIPWGAF